MIEKFKNGKRIDGRRVYFASGQLIYDVVYQDGLIKETKYYQDSTLLSRMLGLEAKREKAPFWKIEKNPQVIARNMDSLRKDIKWSNLAELKTYSSDGRSLTSEGYYPTGQLQTKGYLDWDKKLAGYTYYYKNGKLQSTSTDDQVNDLSVRYDHKEDGTRKEYTEKGRRCATYFNAAAPLQATPEAVYIQ